MNSKFTSILYSILSHSFTVCDSNSSVVREVSSESSATETAKGSLAAVVDTALHTVSYYVPACDLVGGAAVFEPVGDSVNVSHALLGDSLLWNGDGDASVFTGDNSSALFSS